MAEETLLNNTIFSGFLLIVAGCTLALQAGCNATLTRYGGRSFSSFVNFTVGLLSCFIFFGIDIGALHTPLPTSHVEQAPHYAWIAVPKLGVGTSLAFFVCSQVITACIIDNYGLVGVEVRPYTTWRILASLGAVFFVGIITKF
ncbi:uncharacterized protein EV154DRAFT_475631 [Mucor mucedo]|uniref:Uncharacterized protein n=1 Tax=Mucor saturninus TaxID=64648 RepID=A0A8H7VH50_9FUNG|nr:uncharacterized protein EV154DRAFT_475631 [Mucor mucedo]KAG2214329.1 hypothetical protein INT47_000885 [Mucor saturninus]KAI7897308.1 hypothetical protein EV154DRAFT_475631 [Mucor mucedo]